MEDNIQIIITVIISAFILFIFPVYMAYEKKDDISYALAMRYTQDLVDEVRNKGYLTREMYEDYRARLKVTGNSYDIQMTHDYNRYDPITNYYTVDENNKYTLVKTTTQEEKEQLLEEALVVGKLDQESNKAKEDKYLAEIYGFLGDDTFRSEDTYMLSKQVYTTDHIVNILYNEKKLLLNATDKISCGDANTDDGCKYAYIMNVDDNFNVIIKNTNTTLATVIYNMVTANVMDENTRIYVNYGGAILSNKWYGDIDYSKMKHDNITLDKLQAYSIFSGTKDYRRSEEGANSHKVQYTYDSEYALSFDVKPGQVTELREKGKLLVANYAGYNFAAGNKTPLNTNNMLSISVGINGISLVANTAIKFEATTISALNLPGYQIPIEKTREVEEIYTYVDEETGEEKQGVRIVTETYTDYQPGQRKITDYEKLTLTCDTKGKISVTLEGTDGVENFEGIITVEDPQGLLVGVEQTIENPTEAVIEGELGVVANRGTKIVYRIGISDTTIAVSADKYESNEMTILSYPVAIKEYTNVKIAVKEKNTDIYIAELYINGEKVDEGIEMSVIPKVDIIGMTYIGNEPRYFEGYIKNVMLYK